MSGKKLQVNNIEGIVSQIEEEARADKKDTVKILNNLRILIEKNVVEVEDNRKYELEEKIEELRGKTVELCFLRRKLLDKFTENYENKLSKLIENLGKDRKVIKEMEIGEERLDSNLIAWENVNEEQFDCKNLNSRISPVCNKLRKCSEILDEKLTNVTKSDSLTVEPINYCLSYFKNL